ncbi:hypothetical protein CBR_g66728 [Chara braunii]|uniref:Growth-regulating factor n=1 Tax=Chara braunii TaxID=69332 RepID=A0A388JQD8_CHABU|nr:hypothetical protein CBR_g66728 [Chara braunii]|eukprot:GBG59922.1 hypothetical protein CBR_g66728 [Chara braunii]
METVVKSTAIESCFPAAEHFRCAFQASYHAKRASEMGTGPLTELPCLEGSANSWGQSEPVVAPADRSDANRCKRTDGKKWRCTKEVVPEQKYCERHMHRGRHRTRKLQEGQSPGMAACIAAANGVSRIDSAWQSEQYRSLAAACGAGTFGAVAAAAAAAKGGERVTASLSGASISDRIPLAFSQGLICGMHSGLWDPVSSGRKFGPASSLQGLNGVHKDPRLFDRADLYWSQDKPCGVTSSMNPFLPHDLLANLNKNALSTASLQSLPQATTANALRNLVGKVPLSGGGNGHAGAYAASIIPYDNQLRALLTQQQPIIRASSASAVAASMGMGGGCNANGSSTVGGVSATQGTMSIDIGKDSGAGNVEVRSFIDTWPVRWARNDVSSASADDARLQVGRGTSSLSMSIPSPAAAELAARALSPTGGKLSPPRIASHKSDEVDMNRDPTHMGLGVGISLEREEVDQRSHHHAHHHHHHHHQQAAGTSAPPDAQGLAWTMSASGWDVGGPLGEVLHTTTPRGSSTTSAASDSTKADSPGGTQQGFNLLGDGFGQSLRVAGTAGMSGGGELSSLGGSSMNAVSVSPAGGLGVDCSPRDGSTGRMEAFPRATLRKSGNFVSLAESSSGESGHGRGDGGGDGSELGGCVRAGGGGNVGSATGGATAGTVNGGPGAASTEGTGAGAGSILVEGGGLDFVSNLGISSRTLSLSASGTMESACGSGHASENYGVAFPHCDGDVRHLSIDWSL